MTAEIRSSIIYRVIQHSEMPFFGLDWRGPGDKWIRTELGWKRVAEVHANLRMQIAKVAILPSKHGTRRPRSLDTSPRNRTPPQSNSRKTSPLKEKDATRDKL